jgi:hypothetical protein
MHNIKQTTGSVIGKEADREEHRVNEGKRIFTTTGE